MCTVLCSSFCLDDSYVSGKLIFIARTIHTHRSYYISKFMLSVRQHQYSLACVHIFCEGERISFVNPCNFTWTWRVVIFMHRSKKIRTVYIQHEMYSPVHYTYISYIFLVIFLLFKKWSTYCIRLDFENGCTLVIRMRCLFMITRFLSRRRSTCFTSRGLLPAASATTNFF